MNAEDLRAKQAPLKQLYRENPEAARIPARAEGSLDPNDIAIVVDAWHGKVTAGLHKAGGGSGELACSADMLLEMAGITPVVTLDDTAFAGLPMPSSVWDG